MPIASLRDINESFNEGRTHTQRFFKNASTTGDLQWIDWAFASGQPAYDARIGTAGTFNPIVAGRNDAIFFPPIEEGQHRHIVGLNVRTLAGGTGQAVCSMILYDLLGVYPLIDGDSTDEQIMDNSSPLPRYASGEGVLAVMVNHVSPMLAAANGSMNYTDDAGASKTTAIRVALTGQNKIVTANAATGGLGGFGIPLASGSKGIRSVDSVTFTGAPGGLFAIYMVKPIVTILNNDGVLTAEKVFTEKCLCAHNGWNMPRIYDGAHLGFFMMPNGSAKAVSVFGDATFVWK